MKRLTVIFILAALFLCACTPSEIPPEPVVSEDSTVTSAPEKVTEGTTATTLSPEEILEDRTIMSELYGSFLTMRMTGTVNEALDGNYVKVFNNYAEIDGYFSSTDPYYFYGQKFISTLASFDDVFLSQNDVMIVKIDEPSSYISHQNARVRIEDGVLNVGIERHIPPHAPESDTQYHLILTAAKGTFAGLEDLPLQVNITEVIDHGHDTAAAADRYLYIYPDFVPFIYRTDAVGVPSTVIDTIATYDELVEFYEKYKDTYDFEELKKHIGSLYDESVFDDYTLLAVMTPSDPAGSPPKVGDLFVYNLEVYITVENSRPAAVSETTPCYLLITAVSKADLESVNLKLFNISFN